MSGAPQLLVVGSLNMDLIVRVGSLPARGETVTGGSFEMSPGGKGANQAVAAARAGASVALVGAVGADDFGTRLTDELVAEGVDTTAVRTLPRGATGVAAIVVDEGGENQIAVASGANHLLTAGHVERAFEELDLARTRCALFSFELEDEAVLAGAALAAARGMAVVVNPAPARTLAPALLELRPILTPNQGEAAELTGQSGSSHSGGGAGALHGRARPRHRRSARGARGHGRRRRADRAAGGRRPGHDRRRRHLQRRARRTGSRVVGRSTGQPAGRRWRRPSQ